jgi:hypothetical protein
MKRDILFRAMRTDGKGWVEGDLIEIWTPLDQSDFNQAIIPRTSHFRSDGKTPENIIEVISGTVGQFLNLFDSKKTKGFEFDIWQIQDFKYSVKWCDGYKNEKCDLKFYLYYEGLGLQYKFVDAPKDLTFISLATIFNLPLADGKRMFVDENRQKLEIIGNIHETPAK